MKDKRKLKAACRQKAAMRTLFSMNQTFWDPAGFVFSYTFFLKRHLYLIPVLIWPCSWCVFVRLQITQPPFTFITNWRKQICRKLMNSGHFCPVTSVSVLFSPRGREGWCSRKTSLGKNKNGNSWDVINSSFFSQNAKGKHQQIHLHACVHPCTLSVYEKYIM